MKSTGSPRSRFRRRGLVAVWFELLLGGTQMTATGTVGYLWARGHYEWKEAQKQLAASGYSLDMTEIARGAVPDTENFGATPALKGIATRDADQTEEIKAKIERLKAADPLGPSTVRGTPDLPRPEAGAEKPRDWKVLRNWLASPKMNWKVPADEPNDAKAVLTALRDRDPELVKEILFTARRPHASLTPSEFQRAKDMVARDAAFPDIVSAPTVIPFSRHLSIRLEAALATGDRTEVQKLLPAVFGMIKLGGSDRSLMSLLIGLTLERNFHHLLRNGIAAGQFADADLAACQNFLSSLNTARHLNAALNMEAAAGVRAIQTVMATGLNMNLSPNISIGGDHVLLEGLFVEGSTAFIVNSFLSRAKFLEKGDWAGADEHTKVQNDRISSMSWLEKTHLTFALAHALGYGALIPNFAQTEIHRRLLTVACALERRRLAGQELPDTLADLPKRVLAEVPRDLDGQPVRYQPAPQGFVLWSVGLNLKDDWHGALPPVDTKKDVSPRVIADWQIRIP